MRTSRLNRRRFLELSAALAAAAMLPACEGGRREIPGRIEDRDVGAGHLLREGASPPWDLPLERTDVLIAGGGVAGLSAAWRLARAGCHDFRIVELSDQPGGTARSGRLGGMAHPWGAHYLPVPDRRQRSLVTFLEDAGLVTGFSPLGRARVDARNLVRAPAERICVAGFFREGLYPEAGASPDDLRALEHFEELLDRTFAEAPAGAFRLPVAHAGRSHRTLDRLDAASWLRSCGVDILNERLRWYLEYAVRDDYGSRLEQTSAWAFLHYFLSRRLPGEEDSPPYMTWPEGNGFLVRRLLDGLEDRLATGVLVFSAANEGESVLATCLDVRRKRWHRIRARKLILALPQYAAARVIQGDAAGRERRSFRYAPWVVANLHLSDRPEERGFAPAWDSVFLDSPSLGYVDAGHQVDRAAEETVWTWYLPVTDADEGATRRALLKAPFEHWRRLILDDLRPAHPDIEAHVKEIRVWRWGHAMVKPVPGFLFGGARQAASRPVGHIHPAHSDLGGLPLFEEAHWAGSRAAEEVLAALDLPFESLI